jgi:hypothetical protein
VLGPRDLALHHCDVPACCNPAHLFLGTQADNLRDCAAKGRYHKPAGEAHWNARLSDAAVREIRTLYPTCAYSQQDLAGLFGVAKSTIWRVLSGEQWRSVE